MCLLPSRSVCKTGLINFSLEDDEVVALSIALENCFPITFFTAWNEREGGGVGRDGERGRKGKKGKGRKDGERKERGEEGGEKSVNQMQEKKVKY